MARALAGTSDLDIDPEPLARQFFERGLILLVGLALGQLLRGIATTLPPRCSSRSISALSCGCRRSSVTALSSELACTGVTGATSGRGDHVLLGGNRNHAGWNGWQHADGPPYL